MKQGMGTQRAHSLRDEKTLKMFEYWNSLSR